MTFSDAFFYAAGIKASSLSLFIRLLGAALMCVAGVVVVGLFEKGASKERDEYLPNLITMAIKLLIGISASLIILLA